MYGIRLIKILDNYTKKSHLMQGKLIVESMQKLMLFLLFCAWFRANLYVFLNKTFLHGTGDCIPKGSRNIHIFFKGFNAGYKIDRP